MGSSVSHVTTGAPHREGKPHLCLGLWGQAVPQFSPPVELKPLHCGHCWVMEWGPIGLCILGWACWWVSGLQEPAPAAGEAELIPSLSDPRATAFFQDFCWESAPFPPVCPVPSRTSRRPLLGVAVLQRGPVLPNSSHASPSSQPRFPCRHPTWHWSQGMARGHRRGNELTIR